MTRRRNKNAQKPAAEKPENSHQAEAENSNAPQTVPPVDLGRGAAAGAAAPKQPDGAPGADPAALGGVSDGPAPETAVVQAGDLPAGKPADKKEDPAAAVPEGTGTGDAPADGHSGADASAALIDDDAEICQACGKALNDGDLVYSDLSGGGEFHAACLGPERENFVGEDGEPLKEGEPIPEPYMFRPLPTTNSNGDLHDRQGDELDGAAGETDASLQRSGVDTAAAGAGGDTGVQPAISADDGQHVKDLSDADILDANIRFMAGQVLNQVLDGACDVLGATDPLTADDINPHVFDSDIVVDALVAYVRKIGRRATPDVLGHQLKILGHRKAPEISAPERIGLSAFVSLLLDLDELAAAERRRLDAAANPIKPAEPLPIDETTMESVGEFFETF